MKTKIKLLVGAVAVAAAAQASAATVNTDGSVSGLSGTGDGAGDLFMSAALISSSGSILDSYVLNTNVTSTQFQSTSFQSAGTTIAADTNMTNLLTAKSSNSGSSIVWTMGGIDNNATNPGYYLTSPNAVTLAPGGFSGANQAMGNIDSFLNGVNGQLASSNSYLSTGSSGVAYIGTPYLADVPPGNWDAGGNVLNTTSGNAMNMYYNGLNPSDPTFSTSILNEYGKWTLEANGNLVYSTEAAAPVPLPPAVWLLGSALVGLVGVGRRRLQGEAGLAA